MNKNDLRYIKTEELIINSFLDCINHTSFEETTVSMICEKARISRHSFYTHYVDKYALLEKLYKNLEDRFNGTIKEEILNHAKAKNFYPACRRAVTDFIENKDLIILLLKCSRHKVMDIYEKTYIDISTAMYVENYDKKIKKPQLQLTKKFLLHGIIGYLEDYILNNSSLDIDEVIQHLYQLCDQPSCFFFEQLS